MRFHVLACDFDSTLADHGFVSDDVESALVRVRQGGRRLVLVTGRRLGDLVELLPDVNLFAVIVAENGALVYLPDRKEERRLGPPIPSQLLHHLRVAGVRFDAGRGIISVPEREREKVDRVLGYLGLDYQYSFNKASLMILPPGIDKASGLRAALDELGESPQATVAVGDAENDIPLLSACGCAVAVANALDSVKKVADIVLERPDGEGVRELADELLRDDLAAMLGAVHSGKP